MEATFVACRPTQDGPTDSVTPSSTPRRGAAGRRRMRRLAAVITPLVATVVTAAPALAWPETGW